MVAELSFLENYPLKNCLLIGPLENQKVGLWQWCKNAILEPLFFEEKKKPV